MDQEHQTEQHLAEKKNSVNQEERSSVE